VSTHRLTTRSAPPLPAGLALDEDLLRIVVLAGDLVNSYDPVRGRELLTDADALAYILSDHPWMLPPPTPADVAPARDLRGRLDRVFRQAAYDEVDALLVASPPTLALGATADGGRRLLVHAAAGALVPSLAAHMSLALALFLADGTAGRLDVCDAGDCSNVAVRRSSGDAFCSPRCTNLRPRAATRPPVPRSGRPPGRP
jgi:predicted RNA-binding Zn ribbon-like protein